MLIKEADKRLDKICTIAFRQGSVWFKMAERIKRRTPVTIFEEDDQAFLQIYFYKEELPPKFVPTIMASKTAVEKRSYYSLTEKIKNAGDLGIIARILAINSVIASEAYLYGNELTFTFRFHHSVIEQINDVIVNGCARNDSVRLVYLGPSPGIIALLEAINSLDKLSVVRFSIPFALDNPFVQEAMKERIDAISEAEGRVKTLGGYRVLLYPKKQLHTPFIEISKEDLVYQGEAMDPRIELERERGDNARIPRMAVFMRVRRNRLMDTTFVPAAEVDEFVSILMGIAEELGDRGPMLEICSPLTADMWDWL